MDLQPFFQQSQQGLQISRAQASAFAKEIAGDFNPIHDVTAKRFCVPGDLLFCLLLSHYGLSEQMRLSFDGMVDEHTLLLLPEKSEGDLRLCDAQGKCFLQVQHQGDSLRNESIISSFCRQYVQFSGQNFPYILVPMLREKQVMFNVKRPFVIYDSMSFQLDTLALTAPMLSLAGTELLVNGRRGEANFLFDITDQGRRVGSGSKKLLLSGLQPFVEEEMQTLIENFLAAKGGYVPSA